jgi:hypothetical protein
MQLEPHLVSNALRVWLCIILAILGFAFHNHADTDDDSTTFFSFGPNENLYVLNIPIHTWLRYGCVILYTVCSTLFRTLHSEVLSPWIVNSVQTSDAKAPYVQTHALSIITVSVIFTWLDWFMSLKILLSQLDFLLVEVAGNLVVTLYTTKHYTRLHTETYTPLQ